MFTNMPLSYPSPTSYPLPPPRYPLPPRQPSLPLRYPSPPPQYPEPSLPQSSKLSAVCMPGAQSVDLCGFSSLATEDACGLPVDYNQRPDSVYCHSSTTCSTWDILEGIIACDTSKDAREQCGSSCGPAEQIVPECPATQYQYATRGGSQRGESPEDLDFFQDVHDNLNFSDFEVATDLIDYLLG